MKQHLLEAMLKHRLPRPAARVPDSKAKDKIKYLTFLTVSGMLVIVKGYNGESMILILGLFQTHLKSFIETQKTYFISGQIVLTN